MSTAANNKEYYIMSSRMHLYSIPPNISEALLLTFWTVSLREVLVQPLQTRDPD